MKKNITRFYREKPTLTLIIVAILFLALFFLANLAGFYIGDAITNNEKKGITGYILAFTNLLFIGLFIYLYTWLDELQKKLIIHALALAGLLTISVKTTYSFIEIFNDVPNLTALWLMIFHIFSFLIISTILFFKDDDSDLFR